MPAKTNQYSETVELAVGKLREVVNEVVTECRRLDALYDAMITNCGKRRPHYSGKIASDDNTTGELSLSSWPRGNQGRNGVEILLKFSNWATSATPPNTIRGATMRQGEGFACRLLMSKAFL